MAIREATTSVEEPRPSGPRPDRRRRRRDLRAGPFPTAAMDQWHDTEAAPDPALPPRRGQGHRSHRLVPPGQAGQAHLVPRAAPARHPPGHRGRPPAPARRRRPRPQPHRPGLRAARPGRRLHRVDRFFGVSSGWMRAMTTAQALERRLEQLSTTGPPSAPAAPRAPSTPSRSRTAWPCCACSPTTWPPSCSRRRPSGCSSSRATSCAWSGSAPTAPAPAPGRYHCREPPSPRRGRRPGADAQRPRTRAGGAAQAARRRQGVPLTWRARNGSWPGCGSRRRRPTCGRSRSVPGG